MAPRGRRRGHVLHRIRPWKHSLVVVAVNRMRHSAFAYAINRLAAKQRICVFMDISIFLVTLAATGIAVNSQEIGWESSMSCSIVQFVDQ